MSETVNETNIKKCTNHIRGCRVILAEDYQRKKCEECLRKEREREKKRRDAAKVLTPLQENYKICSTCCQEYPLEDFQGSRSTELTKTCKACRDGNKKQDEKRDKEHRNALDRIASKKPERVAKKQEWAENNYEKKVEYWQKCRQRQMLNDHDAYLKRNAENQKKWRENNPERHKEIMKSVRTSTNNLYVTYKREAFARNLAFDLSLEQFESFIKEPCHYCGEFTFDCNINGIDRIDSTIHYTLNNCVSCCNMCNMMKNTLHESTFLARVEHMLMHLQLITDGQMHPEIFSNYAGNSFCNYKKRAEKKQIEFTIDNNDFRYFRGSNCYLCGKPSDENHNNGIDRFDNGMGYVYENCRPCCADCNFMKKHYPYDEFVQKMLLIYNYRKHDNAVTVKASKYMTPSGKKTNDELRQHSIRERERRKEELHNRYTEDEIKRRAAQIAEERKNQKSLPTECIAILEEDFDEEF